MKKYYFRLIIGSILFALIVFGDELVIDGQFNYKGLLWVAYGIIGFGLAFHFLFIYFFKMIKKKNDKKKEN